MGRTIEDYRTFGLRWPRVVVGDFRQAQPRVTAIVAGNDEELASAQFLRLVTSGGCQ